MINLRKLAALCALSMLMAGCGGDTPSTGATTCTDAFRAEVEATGLGIRTLKKGYGQAAEPGDTVSVHYTGWLYDESQPDGRGEKFDSSVDHGAQFPFQLGAGRVIRGWDQGVACMLVGEVRELTIPAEMAYGEQGYPGVIPPGATLVFEVELLSTEAPGVGG